MSFDFIGIFSRHLYTICALEFFEQSPFSHFHARNYRQIVMHFVCNLKTLSITILVGFNFNFISFCSCRNSLLILCRNAISLSTLYMWIQFVQDSQKARERERKNNSKLWHAAHKPNWTKNKRNEKERNDTERDVKWNLCLNRFRLLIQIAPKPWLASLSPSPHQLSSFIENRVFLSIRVPLHFFQRFYV